MMNDLAPTSLTAFGIVDQNTVVLAFVLASLGVVLLIAGWFGLLSGLSRKSDDTPKSSTAKTASLRLILGGAGFFGGLLMSGWVVFAIYTGAFGVFFPTLRDAKKERKQAIARVDAIASWVETIRDNISGAAGLTQALSNSAANAPKPIRTEVRDLVLRLVHEPLVPSLRKFAKDVAHPTCDMAVGCLSQAARDSASMMRQVEAGRVQSQAQAKMVALLASLISVGMILTDDGFLAPYDGLLGQVVLCVVGAIGSGATYAMYKLAKPEEPRRVFAGVETTQLDVGGTTAAIPTPQEV